MEVQHPANRETTPSRASGETCCPRCAPSSLIIPRGTKPSSVLIDQSMNGGKNSHVPAKTLASCINMAGGCAQARGCDPGSMRPFIPLGGRWRAAHMLQSSGRQVSTQLRALSAITNAILASLPAYAYSNQQAREIVRPRCSFRPQYLHKLPNL